MTFRTPNPEEFNQIRNYIREFELDDRQLKQEEFTAAFRGKELVGFGRLRAHADCIELCSLGVVTPHRRQGIGKGIVTHLLQRSKFPIHLVCIIPGYFTPFGFITTSVFPDSIREKLNYCQHELAVPETYVAMIRSK